MKPSVTDLDSLSAFTFLNSQVIHGLKSELPKYLAASEYVSTEQTWWKFHQEYLPNWAQACRLVLLVQPSSAASERVFSILNQSFSSQQESALEDYTQLSVMLQYNYRS